MTSIVSIGIATAASIALVLGGGVVAANAATPTPSPSSSRCSFAQHLRSAWSEVPVALKTDLKSLKAMDPDKARRADAIKIRTEALDGGYGAEIEATAEWRKDHRGERLRPLPANLTADLKTLKSDSKADRPAEAKKIAQGALDGAYGTKIESFAKAVRASDAWQGCAPTGS